MPPVRIKYRKLYRALDAEHPPQGERQAVSAIVGVERGRRASTPEPSPAWGQLPALPFLRSVTWATHSSSLCLCFSSDNGDCNSASQSVCWTYWGNVREHLGQGLLC